MKHPKLRTRKRLKRNNIRKTKYEITEIIEDCQRDIRWYMVKDIMNRLKKRGMFNAKKNKKKNNKKKKK